jgi:glycerophosphoryl diester phosphodiesterase
MAASCTPYPLPDPESTPPTPRAARGQNLFSEESSTLRIMNALAPTRVRYGDNHAARPTPTCSTTQPDQRRLTRINPPAGSGLIRQRRPHETSLHTPTRSSPTPLTPAQMDKLLAGVDGLTRPPRSALPAVAALMQTATDAG